MGGGAKSKSTSTSGSAQFLPQANAAIGQVQNVVNQNQPGLQQLTDMTHSQIVDPLLSKFQQSSPVAGQANDYYSDVLSGKYMGGNPYVSNILQQLNRGVGDQVNSQFEQSGRYGSGAHADVLSRNLADADSNVLYQNYSDEAARRDAAAQAAKASNSADISSLLSAIGVNSQLPYVGTSNLGNSLGALFNGGTSTSTQKGQDPIWGAIGAGLGAAGAAFSDARLKTNIELMHRDPDGLGWYSWNWKAAPNGAKVKGVLAHEVKELRPQAYIPNYRGSGFDGVNYAQL